MRATSDGSPFIPLAAEPAYPPPTRGIDPDRSRSWLQRSLPVLWAHKGIFVASMLLSFFGLVLQIQIPNLINLAISNSLRSHRVALFHYTNLMIVLAVVGSVAGFFSRRYLYELAYNIEFDLRNLVFDHMSRLSFPFFDRVQTGQLISRANSDIRQVQMYLAFGPSILVQFGVALVAFGFMLSINAVLALIAMSSMPLVYWAAERMRRRMFPVSWLIQARLAEVTTLVDENINGVRVVKSFAAESDQVRSLARSADRVRWGYIVDAYLRARFTPQVQNLPRLGFALVLLFGGWMAMHGSATIGQIVAFNAYLLMLQAPFQMLGMIIMMGQRAAASAERIYEIMDTAPSVVDRQGAVDLVECRGDVRFDHVDFRYTEDGPLILSDFDLHVRPGETVAVVGRTGSGKSTISRVLARFYDGSAGAVRIDGTDIRDLTLASLRARVGIVMDEPFLFSASVRDNIAFGRPNADDAEVEAAARAAGAHEFIEQLPGGYESIVGERGYTLSGGQRQRLAIARTLLVNPPVLILDDATSAIDVKVEQEIHRALETLMEGRTTLIIAHRLSTIALARRVVLVDEGRVVADGTHDELMATVPLYAQVLAQSAEEEAPAGSGAGLEAAAAAARA